MDQQQILMTVQSHGIIVGVGEGMSRIFYSLTVIELSTPGRVNIIN